MRVWSCGGVTFCGKGSYVGSCELLEQSRALVSSVTSNKHKIRGSVDEHIVTCMTGARQAAEILNVACIRHCISRYNH